MCSERYELCSTTPTRIGLLRALKVGDLLCAVPAVRALKRAAPKAHITLIGLPWSREFVERFSHYFSDFIEFPGWPGLPEQELRIEAIPTFLSDAHKRDFDLVIQMHGSGSYVNELAQLLGARHLAGFYPSSADMPDVGTFIPYPEQEPELWRCLRLARHLGGIVDGEDLEFPLSSADFQQLYRVLPETVRRGAFVVVHPGALANRQRLWPSENFAEVARGLRDRGMSIVLTGTEQEGDLVAELAERIGAGALDLSGKTSLGSLGALLSHAKMVLCHDTGVSHMAAALRVPSIIVFDRSDREGWPPADRQLHRFMARFESIRPSDVLAEVDDLIRYVECCRSSDTRRSILATAYVRGVVA